MEKKDVIEYWSNPNDERNYPIEYAKYTKRSIFLLELFEKYIDKSSKIIELGCNVGRNLNALQKAGYNNLTGIDINQNALNLMEKFYPNLEANIRNIKIEDFLKENKKYDVMFTMAVFMHIPFENNWIFKNISDLTRKHIIVIEDEGSNSWKNFARKYKDIFEDFGWKELLKRPASGDYELGENYIARVFKKE